MYRFDKIFYFAYFAMFTRYMFEGLKELIGIIAALLVFIAYIPYFKDILANKTKPHSVSWFIWGLNTTLIFGVQISNGAGAGSYATLLVALISFAISAFGLRNGLSHIKRMDIAILLLALVAAGVWYIAKDPIVAMILLVFGDVLGIIPSIRKAWRKPSEETLSMWAISTVRQVLSLAALAQYTIVSSLNPIVWLVLNGSMSLVVYLRRKHIKGARKSSAHACKTGPNPS